MKLIHLTEYTPGLPAPHQYNEDDMKIIVNMDKIEWVKSHESGMTTAIRMGDHTIYVYEDADIVAERMKHA
jgi:hypothetical protein